jgi:hypothetical protein
MSCLLIVYVMLEVSDSFGEPRSVRVARDPASRSESILLVRNGVVILNWKPLACRCHPSDPCFL